VDGDFLPAPELPPERITPSADAQVSIVPFEQTSEDILYRMILRAGSDGVSTSSYRGLSGLRTKKASFFLNEIQQTGLIRIQKKNKASTYTYACGGGGGAAATGEGGSEEATERYADALRALLVEPFSLSALDMIKQAQKAVNDAFPSENVSLADGLSRLIADSSTRPTHAKLTLPSSSERMHSESLSSPAILPTIPPSQISSHTHLNSSYWMVSANVGGSIGASGELCAQIPRLLSTSESSAVPVVKDMLAPYLTNVGSSALSAFSHRMVVLDRSSDVTSLKPLGFASEIDLLSLPGISQKKRVDLRKTTVTKTKRKRQTKGRDIEEEDDDEEDDEVDEDDDELMDFDVDVDDDLDSVDLFNSFISGAEKTSAHREGGGKSGGSGRGRSSSTKSKVKRVRDSSGQSNSARDITRAGGGGGGGRGDSTANDESQDDFKSRMQRLYRDHHVDIVSLFSANASSAGPNISRIESALRSKAVPSVKLITLARRDSAALSRLSKKEIKRHLNQEKPIKKSSRFRLNGKPLPEYTLSFASKFTFERDPLRKTRRRFEWTVSDNTALLRLYAINRAQRELHLQADYVLEQLQYLQVKHAAHHLRSFGARFGTRTLSANKESSSSGGDAIMFDESLEQRTSQVDLLNEFLEAVESHGGDEAFAEEEIISVSPIDKPDNSDVATIKMTEDDVERSAPKTATSAVASSVPEPVTEKNSEEVKIAAKKADNLDICVRCYHPAELFCCDECVRSFCCPCYGLEEPPPDDPWICGECDQPLSNRVKRAQEKFLSSLANSSRGPSLLLESNFSPLSDDSDDDDDDDDNEADDEKRIDGLNEQDSSQNIQSSLPTSLDIHVLSPKVSSLFNKDSWFGVPLAKTYPTPTLVAPKNQWDRISKALSIDESSARRRFKILLKSKTFVNQGNDYLSQERSKLGVILYREPSIGETTGRLARAEGVGVDDDEDDENDFDEKFDDISNQENVDGDEGFRDFEEGDEQDEAEENEEEKKRQEKEAASTRLKLIRGGKGLDPNFGHYSPQAAFGGQVTGDAAGRSIVYSLWPGLTSADLMLLTRTLNDLINESPRPFTTTSEALDFDSTEHKTSKSSLRDAASELSSWCMRSRKKAVSIVQLFTRMRSFGWLRKERSSLKKESSSLTDLSSLFWQRCFHGATVPETTHSVIDQIVNFNNNTSKLVNSEVIVEQRDKHEMEIGFDPPLGAPASIFPTVVSDALAASSSLLSTSSSSSSSSSSARLFLDPPLKIDPSPDESVRIVRYLESKCGRISTVSSSSNDASLLSAQPIDHQMLGEGEGALSSSASASLTSPALKAGATLFTSASRGVGTFLQNIAALRKDPTAAALTEADEGEEGGGGEKGPTSASKRKNQMAEVAGWRLMLNSHKFVKGTSELRNALLAKANEHSILNARTIFSRALKAAKPHINDLFDDIITAGPMGLETRSMRAFIEFRRQKGQGVPDHEKLKERESDENVHLFKTGDEENDEEESEQDRVKEESIIKSTSFEKYSPFVQDAVLRMTLLQQHHQQESAFSSSSSSSSSSNPKLAIMRAVPFDCDVFVNVSSSHGFRKLYTQPARSVSGVNSDQKESASGLSPVFLWSSLNPSRCNTSTLMVMIRQILFLVLKKPHIDEASILRGTPAIPPGNTRMILRFLSRVGMLKRTFRLAVDAEIVFAKPTLFSRSLAPWDDDGNELDDDNRERGGGVPRNGELRLAETEFLNSLRVSLPECADHVLTLSDAVHLWEQATSSILSRDSHTYDNEDESNQGILLIENLESQPASECPISGGIITQYCATSSSQIILGILGEILSSSASSSSLFSS
jgi:hypothetical protein